MEVEALTRKLQAIEALFAGAKTPGEQQAADAAAKRILSRLEEVARQDPPIEYQFTVRDSWSRKLFVALLRRYGLTPYRYHRQRYTTVMVRVPKSFVDKTLWPEFEQLNETLSQYLADVTNRVITDALHADSAEAEVRNEPKQLATG
ncbi:MAG: hypothetical protein QGH33_08080 [Pirellulaceae bacterium]|jgi:hypothetical protein|nr:hypothetical protein [Pirellulaceae bacterium]